MSKEIILNFSGKLFGSPSDNSFIGIKLVLDDIQQKWLLHFDNDTALIDRRTAERQARSIAKSGFLDNNIRVGAGYELEIVGNKPIPERLLHDQHQY